VTLVAGLENVQFKLQNVTNDYLIFAVYCVYLIELIFKDVPYLDHSCWPTHLNIKRHVVDAILNSSTPLLVKQI